MTPQPNARLNLIDFLMEFVGFSSRKDLIGHFGIGSATASRDFKQYEAINSGGVQYNVRKRRYERTASFLPRYKHDINDALTFLTSNKWVLNHPNPGFNGGVSYTFPDGTDPKCVSAVSRAIADHYAIKIEYAAASSGHSTRTVSPHAFLNNGLTWYVRCHDQKSNEFRTFRLSRFLNVDVTRIKRETTQSVDYDVEWNDLVTITIAPHPKQSNDEAFRRDLGLTDKPVLNFTVPSATVGFVLSALRVDCSIDASMNHHQFPFRCMNLHELKDIDSMMIAPIK